MILGLLSGFLPIASQIAGAYKAKEQAKSDRARVEAEERIKTLEARRDVMVAEGSPINAWIRALIALPVAIYYAKIFLWDKVLGWGVTDPLSPELTQVSQIVLGFYFLFESAKLFRRR